MWGHPPSGSLEIKTMLANAQDLILSEVVRAAGVFFGSEFIVSEVMISMMGGVEIQVGKAAILAEALIRATSESELLQILSGQSWTKEVAEGLRSMYGLLTQAVWILIGKQVKTFDLKIDQHRRLTTKTKGDLRILYLFGLAVSVAASVIASLLLLSGDIEQNPGPDLDYNSVDATQVLSEDDLIDVLEAVLPIKSVYFALGRALRLKTADLRSIQAANPSESDAEEALSDALELWLQQKYNVEKIGPPTWRILVEAVDRKGGGNNPELAKKIADEHPATAAPISSQTCEEISSAKNDLDYNSVDATQVLSEDDLIDILEELLPIKTVYRALGRSLRLKTADLKSIQEAYLSDSDAEQALSDTLELWLQQKYKVEKFGPPTWRMLVEAVDRKTGGNNPELAKKIASDHLAMATPISSQTCKKIKAKNGHQSPVPVPVTDSDNHSSLSEQSSGLVLTLGATNQSLQVPDEATATSDWVLKEENLSALLSYIKDFSHKWSSIGIGLGFTPPELEEIKAMPSLFNTAPKSYLIELLNQWVQWPTTKHPTKPTLRAFCSALRNFVDLGSLADKVETGMNQAAPSCIAPDNERKEYKKYLMSLYAQLIPTETSPNQWPPPPTKSFFQLAMIKEKAVQRGKIEDDFVRQTIKGNVEDILHEKCPVKLEDIFGAAPDGHQKLILIEGAPGSGKSTLSAHIVLECSRGKLFAQYELVYLVRLRDPEVQKATCFSDLLPSRDEEMRQKAADTISSNDGQGVLFVFDGWDELQLNLRANSIFYDMIFPANKKLHNCTVIVTSRPIASADLRKVASTRIEILGFPPATLKEYFTECLKSDSAVSALLGKIKENPVVASYCSIPLIASILVHIFECEKKLPTTQYGIFSELILTCIYRHYTERYGHEDLSLDSFEQLPEDINCSLMYICGIAYKGILDNEVTFSGLPKEFDTLSLLNGAESILMRGKKMYYTFIHLSIQEFLAAYHIAKLVDAEQVCILDELFGRPRFTAMFQFYAAISKLQTPGISDIVAKVARRCIAERYSHENKTHLIILLSCLFESQNSDLCTAVASHLDKQLQLDGVTFTPSDCLSVDFFLSNTAGVKVDLNNCSIRGEMISFLFKRGNTYNLQNLDLIGNKMGDDGVKAISSGMSTMANLQKLNLSDNKIGDEGARAIAYSMHNMTSLQILDLSYNQIGDEGANAMSLALKKMKFLQKLDLSSNSIGGEGATTLSSSMKTMSTLETLSLSRNKVGNDGATAISSALKAMTSLSNDEGRVDTALSLKKLDLSSNKVGDKGATATSSALERVTRLITLDLSINEIGDEGVKAISSSLSTLSSLQMLSLSENKIGDEGAIALSSAFKSMTCLQVLYISVNKIGNEGAKALSSAMKTMTSLHELDLLDNLDITKEGIETFKEVKESKEGYKTRILVGKLQII